MSMVSVEQALRPPPAEVGPRLAQIAEDQWFDRKSARVAARDLADAEIGFGNAEGGTIVVGLRDGETEGTDRAQDRRNELMQAHMQHATPPVRVRSRIVPCERADGTPDHLLVIDIEPGSAVHANGKDQVFLRVGDENRRLTFAQRQELSFDKGESTYEARTTPETSTTDLNEALLENYARAVGAQDPERLLQARGLLSDGGLTVACCLLFAEHPQRCFPEAFVRVLRYRGTERGAGASQQLLEDHRAEGPIPLQLREARLRIQELQPTRRALLRDGQFGPVPLVPEDAWLEALVNAVVHRSYSIGGDHIRVEIFDDRLEISSPGRFPGIVNLSSPLDAPRFARNPRIARVCADLRFGQELGEGIRRMFQEMRDAGLHDPAYRQTAASTIVTLSAEPVHDHLDAQLNDWARPLVTALRTTPGGLSTGEIAGLLGVSQPTALRRLRRLEQKGVVVWDGKSPRDPRAAWKAPPV